MKRNDVSPRRRAPRIDTARRAQLLAAFDRSGLSAAAFARQHGLHYTTFCAWRRRFDRGQASPAFVQVELAPPTPSSELVIELGRTTRLRVASVAQLPLAARLLQILQEGRPC
jgi:transposase-like protein